MATFSKLLISRATSSPTPVPRPAEPSSEGLSQLIPAIHRMLLDNTDGTRSHIAVGSKQRLTAIWVPAGQTAGVVFWARKSQVEAASILACGLDPAEDARALSLAERACDFASWCDASVEVALARRPLLATIYGSADDFADTALATVTTAWATAFFEMFGVSEEGVTQSPP